jgi:hypothetical protein
VYTDAVTQIRLSAPSQFCKLTIPGIHNLLTHSLSTGSVTQNFLKFGEGSLYAICIEFILKCHGRRPECINNASLWAQFKEHNSNPRPAENVLNASSPRHISRFVEHITYVESLPPMHAHARTHTHKRLSVV